MAHNLFRLAESIYNTPHLITESGLAPIVDYVANRNTIEFAIVPDAKERKATSPKQVNKVGEILVDGALTYKPIQAACAPEGCSYEGILKQAQMLIEEGVTTLITVHSSPGGQASHAFSTANDLRAMCDEAGVKWYAYIDTMSASASLALNVAADEVIIHPDASTGSVGCVVALLDKSKAMAQAGLKPIYISSTPGKTPFAEDGSFSKEFLAEMQEEVTRLGNMFAEHVHKYTSVPVKDILAMNAKMFHAEAALEAGLVNKIMDHKQFAAYVAETHLAEPTTSKPPPKYKKGDRVTATANHMDGMKGAHGRVASVEDGYYYSIEFDDPIGENPHKWLAEGDIEPSTRSGEKKPAKPMKM